MTETDLRNLSKAELIDRVQTLEGELQAERSGVSRRGVLRGGLTVAGLATLLYASDPVAAAPTGTFPEETSDPLLKVRADRLRLVPRTSDPSSPDDGTMWFNESA